MSTSLSNLPVKGTSDWFPEECAIRRYIFDTWRRVNRQFGYEEYLTPILESAEIYRAKSGADIGGKELMTMTDQAGRELALRPEMTPSVMRMVTHLYRQSPKPLRLFSIANFWRNEKPQRGRNREFWQLNTDIFGSNSLNADFEILQLALELMLAFGPARGSFTLYLNHRNLLNTILTDIANIPGALRLATVRVLDKYQKLGEASFYSALQELGLQQHSIQVLRQFMQSQNMEHLLEFFPMLRNDAAYQQLTYLLTTLQQCGYGQWIAFNPSIIRGFDYYDGMVFEIFDQHPENLRALFGGGRYNGLAGIFGQDNIPAVGFAPGDETMRLFLTSWNLLPDSLPATRVIYIPLLDEQRLVDVAALAAELRQAGYCVEQGVEAQSMKQALKYANRKQFPYVTLIGEDEAAQGDISLKNMKTGKQHRFSRAELPQALEF